MDLVMRSERMPHAGETMFGRSFSQAEGGKGANQAVASARLGANVAMVGKVGNDSFGAQLGAALRQDGVDVTHVGISPEHATGVAVIMVDDEGENRIVLAPGANLSLCAADVDAAADLIGHAAYVVLQLEVPMDAVVRAAHLAGRSGARVVLNPAPAAALPAELWQSIDYLVPNETEAEALTGIRVHDAVSASQASRALRSRGVRHVLITLGAKGVFLSDDAGERLLPARDVAAKDTTAAGDCFIGGMVAGLCEDMPLDAAAQLGIAAASLCVMRHGAQLSLPYRAELAALPNGLAAG